MARDRLVSVSRGPRQRPLVGFVVACEPCETSPLRVGQRVRSRLVYNTIITAPQIQSNPVN